MWGSQSGTPHSPWSLGLNFTCLLVPEYSITFCSSSIASNWYSREAQFKSLVNQHVGMESKFGLKVMAWKGNQWIVVLSNGKDTCCWEEKFGGKEEKPGSAQPLPVITFKNWGSGDSLFWGPSWEHTRQSVWSLYREYQKVDNIQYTHTIMLWSSTTLGSLYDICPVFCITCLFSSFPSIPWLSPLVNHSLYLSAILIRHFHFPA